MKEVVYSEKVERKACKADNSTAASACHDRQLCTYGAQYGVYKPACLSACCGSHASCRAWRRGYSVSA